MLVQPPERALDNPAPRSHVKARLGPRGSDDLEIPSEALEKVVDELSGVGTVGPNLLEPRHGVLKALPGNQWHVCVSPLVLVCIPWAVALHSGEACELARRVCPALVGMFSAAARVLTELTAGGSILRMDWLEP